MLANGKGISRLVTTDLPAILQKVKFDNKLNQRIQQQLQSYQTPKKGSKGACNNVGSQPTGTPPTSIALMEDKEVANITEVASESTIEHSQNMVEMHPNASPVGSSPTNEMSKISKDTVGMISENTLPEDTNVSKPSDSTSENVGHEGFTGESQQAKATDAAKVTSAGTVGRENSLPSTSTVKKQAGVHDENGESVQREVANDVKRGGHKQREVENNMNDHNTCTLEMDKLSKTIQHLENVLVEAMKNAYDDIENKQQNIHGQEIALLRKEITELTLQSQKREKQCESLTSDKVRLVEEASHLKAD
jgi:hypothetical protein